MKRRIISLVLIVIMLFTLVLTSCGKKGDDEQVTIGVILYGKDDPFGAAEYAYINSAAEALNVNIKWHLGDYTPEDQLTAAENLVADGCQGLLFLPIADNTVELIGDYCKENHIWFQMMNRDIGDATIKAATQANPYYVGTSFEANEDACDYMTHVMTEAGRTQLGLGKVAAGSSLSLRNDYYTAAAAKYNATILANYTAPNDGTTQGYITAIENFKNSYPSMNGIIMSSGSGGAGETILAQVSSKYTAEQMKVATFDTFEGMADYFEQGYIACIAGGIEIQSLFDFVLLFNAVDGHKLSDSYTVLLQKFIFITNSEDCTNYAKYISNPSYMIYSAETIRSMTVRYNPECTLETIQAIMDAYTLESVVAAAPAD